MAGPLTLLFDQAPGGRRQPLPAAKPWLDAIDTQSAEIGIDPAIARALLFAESAGGYRRSVSGAEGPWQMTPQMLGTEGVPFAHNPEIGTMNALTYFRDLLKKYGGDESKAVAAYNAGPTRVNKAGALSSGGLDTSLLTDETKRMLSRYWEMRRD